MGKPGLIFVRLIIQSWIATASQRGTGLMRKMQNAASIASYALCGSALYYAFALFTGWGHNWDIELWEPKARAALFMFGIISGVVRTLFLKIWRPDKGASV